MQAIREKEGGGQSHHKQKGGDNTIRWNTGGMTDSKTFEKVAREGATWQRNKNQ